MTAWTSLLQFLAKDTDTSTGTLLDLVSSNAANRMTKDASMFAVSFGDPGGGWGALGGLGYQTYSELPITSPMLACLNSPPSLTYDINRYARFTTSFAGDPMLLGAFASFMKEKWLSMRNPPTIKPIDLNIFVEVLALVLQKAMTYMLADPQNQIQNNEYATATLLQDYLQAFICPLSLSEVQICLRAILMNVLKETQPFVQAIYPRQSQTQGSNLFIPLLASANTCALGGATGMLLPKILVENIKACTFSIINGGKGDNPHIALPLAGSYSNDVLDPADYEVPYSTANFPNQTLPLFFPEPSNAIRINDGTLTAGTPVFINDPQALNMLIDKFNTWLNFTQLAGFMSKLVTVGTDAGPTILTNMNCTSYWTPVSQQTIANNKMRKDYYTSLKEYRRVVQSGGKCEKPAIGFTLSAEEKRFGVKLDGSKHLSTSPYAGKQIILYTFAFAPYQAVWETFQQFNVKPVINAVTESDLNTSNQPLRIAAQQQEFIQLVPSTASTVTVLTQAQLNNQFAEIMVGPRNIDIKGGEFEDMYDAISRGGKAGLFEDLASAVGAVSQVAVPLASAFLMRKAGKKGIMPN